jgi:hypothetical protein
VLRIARSLDRRRRLVQAELAQRVAKKLLELLLQNGGSGRFLGGDSLPEDLADRGSEQVHWIHVQHP